VCESDFELILVFQGNFNAVQQPLCSACFYYVPSGVAEYFDERVCLSVCVSVCPLALFPDLHDMTCLVTLLNL